VRLTAERRAALRAWTMKMGAFPKAGSSAGLVYAGAEVRIALQQALDDITEVEHRVAELEPVLLDKLGDHGLPPAVLTGAGSSRELAQALLVRMAVDEVGRFRNANLTDDMRNVLAERILRLSEMVRDHMHEMSVFDVRAVEVVFDGGPEGAPRLRLVDLEFARLPGETDTQLFDRILRTVGLGHG
jgi:hypothetical protein